MLGLIVFRRTGSEGFILFVLMGYVSGIFFIPTKHLKMNEIFLFVLSRIRLLSVRLVMFATVIINVVCKERGQASLAKQPRETNPFKFMRLLFLRLVYGVASMMGFQESLSEAFVPPGVDDDYGGFGRDSDYGYSDNDDYY